MISPCGRYFCIPATATTIAVLTSKDCAPGCRHVRRAAVVSLAAVAHQKAGLVAQTGVLGRVMPLLYAQTVVREDLIRTVDLGPFKHKVRGGGAGVVG
jgi:hypothetical protein